MARKKRSVSAFVNELCSPLAPPSRKEREKLRDVADDLCERLADDVRHLRREDQRRKTPSRIKSAHVRAIKNIRAALKVRVREILGEMCERYRARHAWIFVPETARTLKALVSYRTCLRNHRIRVEKRAVVSQVARTLQAYAAPETSNDPFYEECIGSTRSELAVPIVSVGSHVERRLLGVVNFESYEPGNFTKEMERPAEIDARELALPLICLQSQRPGELERWPFYPPAFGWNVDKLLGKLCHHFTTGLAEDNADADLSATIWLADWEEGLLWAWAPSGYDNEYRSLPLKEPSVTWEGAKSPRGKVLRTTPDDPLFKDKDKARRMGMERVLSTPIFEDETASETIGVLNVCQFRTAAPTAVASKDALPPNETVVEFAKLVGQVTTAFEQVREEAAAAHLDWRMEVCRHSTEAKQLAGSQFHALKEVLRECLSADGCSIFLPDENNEYLDLVSSTGIRGERLCQHEGRWVVRGTEPTRFPLRDETKRSVMQFLFDNPGMAVVLNRVSDISRHKRLLRHGLPERIYPDGLEHITPDVVERRFLGIGIRVSNRTWCVIRLVRSTENPPFTVADGRLLEALAGLCSRSAYWEIPAETSVAGHKASGNTAGGPESEAADSGTVPAQPCKSAFNAAGSAGQAAV